MSVYEADERLLKHFDMAKLYENSEFAQRYENASVLNESALLESLSEVDKRYKSIEEIGRGGMKRIVRAVDSFTNREVALATQKTIDSETDIKNFLQEACLTASLQHQNIMPVYDVGVDSEGRPFFTMKLIEGESLHEIINKIKSGNRGYKAKFNLRSLITIFIKICDAIDYAHSKNIVHLDLKPQNVQIGEHGEVLVCDWGIARSLDDEIDDDHHSSQLLQEHEATLDSFIKGTPGYMSPEQALGDFSSFSKKTDIYSLGAILYSILTLEKPCESRSIEKIIDKTINGEIIIPSYLAPERNIPDALERICLKCLETESVSRYISVNKLVEDIRFWEEGFLTSVEDPTFFGQLSLFYNRNRRYLIGAAAVLLFFLGTISFFVMLLFQSAERANAEREKAELTLEELQKSEEEKGRLSLDASEQIFSQAQKSLERGDLSKAVNSIRYAMDLNPQLKKGWRVLAMVDLLKNRSEQALTKAKKSKDKITIDFCSDAYEFSKDQPEEILGELWHLTHVKNEHYWKKFIYSELKNYHTLEAAEEVIKMLKTVNDLEGFRMRAEMKKGKLSLLLNDHELLKDVSPLAALAISNLELSGSSVTDLTPLTGQPLTHLNLYHTKIVSLEFCRGMPLKYINYEGSEVQDLQPLKETRVETIVHGRGHFDIKILNQLKTLKNISFPGGLFSKEDLKKIPKRIKVHIRDYHLKRR